MTDEDKKIDDEKKEEKERKEEEQKFKEKVDLKEFFNNRLIPIYKQDIEGAIHIRLREIHHKLLEIDHISKIRIFVEVAGFIGIALSILIAFSKEADITIQYIVIVTAMIFIPIIGFEIISSMRVQYYEQIKDRISLLQDKKIFRKGISPQIYTLKKDFENHCFEKYGKDYEKWNEKTKEIYVEKIEEIDENIKTLDDEIEDIEDDIKRLEKTKEKLEKRLEKKRGR